MGYSEILNQVQDDREFDVILGLTQNLSPVRKYYLSKVVEKKEILLFKYSIENNL
jgi:hypothetical protein